MDNLVNDLLEIREVCNSKIDMLRSKHKISEEVPPVVGLAMCFNWATISAEQLRWYSDLWGKLRAPVGPETDRKIAQNADRVLLVEQSLFVFCLSSIEYSIKEAVRSYDNFMQVDLDKKPTLRKLIRKSHSVGLIDALALDRWLAVIELRNSVVHNNGISDKNLHQAFPSGNAVSMIKGEPVRADLKVLPRLVRWSTASYADWCDGFLSKVV